MGTASSRQLSNSLQPGIRFAAADFWDRGACRIRGRPCNDSMPSLGSHSFRRPQRSSRSCRERETFEGERSCHSSSCSWMCWTGSLFDSRVRALLSLVRLQYFFSEAQGFRRDFNELIVGDEFDGLLQVQRLEWDEADGFVGGRGAHVRQLLLANRIHVEICVLGVLPDDHAFVEFDSPTDEEFTAIP